MPPQEAAHTACLCAGGIADADRVSRGYGYPLEAAGYDAFGVPVKQTGSYASNPWRYSGYYYDWETKLYDLKARFYNAQLARFLQEDTYYGSMQDPLSLNLYTYCFNNPLTHWDPTGHAVTIWDTANVKNASDLKKLADNTNAWSNAKTQAEKDAIHKNSEDIRNKYRNDNEYGSANADGHTVSTRTGGISKQADDDAREYFESSGTRYYDHVTDTMVTPGKDSNDPIGPPVTDPKPTKPEAPNPNPGSKVDTSVDSSVRSAGDLFLNGVRIAVQTHDGVQYGSLTSLVEAFGGELQRVPGGFLAIIDGVEFMINTENGTLSANTFKELGFQTIKVLNGRSDNPNTVKLEIQKMVDFMVKRKQSPVIEYYLGDVGGVWEPNKQPFGAVLSTVVLPKDLFTELYYEAVDPEFPNRQVEAMITSYFSGMFPLMLAQTLVTVWTMNQQDAAIQRVLDTKGALFSQSDITTVVTTDERSETYVSNSALTTRMYKVDGNDIGRFTPGGYR